MCCSQGSRVEPHSFQKSIGRKRLLGPADGSQPVGQAAKRRRAEDEAALGRSSGNLSSGAAVQASTVPVAERGSCSTLLPKLVDRQS